ncbi:MAG: dTMP kinase [Proteobacteria bacterium]|nr:dTMP kinase [Pseudomonadota bacterium]
MGPGKFITFEGGEGAGKSTQIKHLAAHLESQGIPVLTTREPGGSEGAEAIRELLVTGEPDRWDASSEALLNFAARRNHVETVIKPALEKGIWVLSDRFADSTTVYQGLAGGLGEDNIKKLYDLTLGNFAPDLTLILDLPAELGLKRSNRRHQISASNEDRYERKDKAFHQDLRAGFRKVARDNPERCVLVDATGSEEKIEKAIRRILKDRLGV